MYKKGEWAQGWIMGPNRINMRHNKREVRWVKRKGLGRWKEGLGPFCLKRFFRVLLICFQLGQLALGFVSKAPSIRFHVLLRSSFASF